VGLACGFYLNELLLALLPRLDPCPELFDAYAACLAALSEERSPAGWLRWFEYRLLRQLGEITSWQFSNESGLQASYVLDDDGQWLESTLHHAVRGELIGSIARGDCDAIEQVKQKPLQDIFRSRLEHLLGGRRLHSRDMLEVYRTKRSSRHKGGAG
jgi:recombinational DNA repair protein (RecF pathway)